MRKVILGAAISLDGYLARLNGSVDFLVTPKGASKKMSEFFATLDTVVMGRKTWSASQSSAGAAPQGPWTTYVFSRSQPPGEREGAIFVNESPSCFVAELRQRRGKHIFLMGGGELARSFLETDLVDELSLALVPVLLGEGIPLFPRGFPQRDFALIENTTASKGLVGLKYKRACPKG